MVLLGTSKTILPFRTNYAAGFLHYCGSKTAVFHGYHRTEGRGIRIGKVKTPKSSFSFQDLSVCHKCSKDYCKPSVNIQNSEKLLTNFAILLIAFMDEQIFQDSYILDVLLFSPLPLKIYVTLVFTQKSETQLYKIRIVALVLHFFIGQ